MRWKVTSHPGTLMPLSVGGFTLLTRGCTVCISLALSPRLSRLEEPEPHIAANPSLVCDYRELSRSLNEV